MVTSTSPTASYVNDNTFWVYNGTSWIQDLYGIYSFEIGRGPNVAGMWVTNNGSFVPVGNQLVFQWKHYADNEHRIDPASTNIIDIYVLTFSYDNAVRQWIANGAVAGQQPTVPTELDLSIAFSSLEEFRMFSDTIIWHPVSYKFLFGPNADPETTSTIQSHSLAKLSSERWSNPNSNHNSDQHLFRCRTVGFWRDLLLHQTGSLHPPTACWIDRFCSHCAFGR